MTVAECISNFNLTTDTPHLALTGELWGVYCEYFGENWLHYNSTALYFAHIYGLVLVCAVSRALQTKIRQQCNQPSIGGILPKGPYLPCVSMAGRALLAGYPVCQIWRRTGNFLLIFRKFYVYDLRFKVWGPITFLTDFETLITG